MTKATALMICVFSLLAAAAAGVIYAAENGGAAPPPKEGETPAAPDGERKEIEKLVEQFKSGDAEVQKKAGEQLVAKGEAAIEPLMNLAKAEDKALAERAKSALAKIGVVDGLYVKIALFRDEFLPGEIIGVRFIFRNYGAKTVTVFNPARAEETGLGFSLTLKDEKTGKEIAQANMNERLQAAGGPAPQLMPILTRDSFAPLKPGEKFEEIVRLHRLFSLAKVDNAEYVISGKYVGKTKFNEEINKNAANYGVENLLESEVEPRPLRFSVGDPRAGQPDEAKKKQIERWIKELGDEEYDVREAAEASLEKEGPVVLPFVRKALDDPDIQIRETAARLVRKLAESKKEMVTYLGISMNLMQQGEGVQVMNVMEKTSAREYGLQVGDVILKMDGTTIPGESYDTRVNWLRKQIQSRRPGDKIKLTVKRGDEEKEFEIPLGEVSKEVVGEN